MVSVGLQVGTCCLERGILGLWWGWVVSETTSASDMSNDIQIVSGWLTVTQASRQRTILPFGLDIS
jgi:hypothetical protein